MKFQSISAKIYDLESDWSIQVSMVTQNFSRPLTPACTSRGAYLTLYQVSSFYLQTTMRNWLKFATILSKKFQISKTPPFLFPRQRRPYWTNRSRFYCINQLHLILSILKQIMPKINIFQKLPPFLSP